MEIRLYKTNDDPRHITKTFSGTVKTYNLAYATHELDLLKPDIQISDLGLSEFNYMYIPELSRYYFIHPVITANGFYTLNARCDVLMSHANAIKAQSGILERSETIYNTYLTDEAYKSLVYRRTQTIPFPGHPFTTQNGGYYLITTGGYTPPEED